MDALLAPLNNGIALPADKEGRYRNLGRVEGSKKLRVSVDIPIPAQTTPKAASAIGFRIDLQVVLGKPGWKLVRFGKAFHEGMPLGYDRIPALRLRWVAGKRVEHPP